MTPRALFRRLALLTALLAGLHGVDAAAHLTPNSEIRLSIGQHAVSADIIVPQGEYAYGTGNRVGNDARALDIARRYLIDHMRFETPDGRPWSIALDTVEFKQIAGPPDLHAIATLTPPAGASTRSFTVRWHVLIDELPNHFALFVLSGDSAGALGGEREILGAVRNGSATITIDRGTSSYSIVFANAMLLGAHHILGGYDHLMFLLALLLPASLVARGGRWRDPRPPRAVVSNLLRIVTAFTIGHSLTLIGATLFHLRLPPAPVEVAIAISVLVSAIHAIRPIFPGREPLVALLFGLIHGLAFATLLANAGASMESGAISLFGFNLGIEVVQVGIVALVIPPLIVLLRRPGSAVLRVGAASFAAAAALAWIVNRTTGLAGELTERMEMLMSHALLGVGVLIVAALACLASDRFGSRRPAALVPAPR